jgi:hypothetical protein
VTNAHARSPSLSSGKPTDGNARYGRVARQERLDLDDGHALPASLDDVLGAAIDADVAFVVDAIREVAGIEPTVRVHPNSIPDA